MEIVSAILLILIGWMSHVLYTQHQNGNKRNVASVAPHTPTKAEDIPWGNTCGYKFDD